MNKVKIAINGFGRIGRVLTRAITKHNNIELVAVNDLADSKMLSHLLQYDSIHRQFPGEISYTEHSLSIDNKEIQVFNEKNPEHLPWKELGIDIVVECTGIFRTKESASKHITAGAKKVIISAPAKSGDVPSVVIGINEAILNGNEEVISNASCTTNCAAPMVKIIDDLCGIESSYLTTIHSYTGDQRILDAPHRDYRRARAAAESIIPTTTGAAIAVTKILPHLEGKINGSAVRVPTPDGSLTDITFLVKQPTTKEAINAVFKKASETNLKGILEYTEDPIVSSDIIGNPHSCIIDGLLTEVNGRLVKVVGWYDNETGYSNRLADLINLVG
ncbi:MAG: type I glyceraldehyde-3-phosphate dehydrogenase [Flavobacteriales bacterium]|jgi:glyceraldehyde 3-phosphate dehydrogenase|nr:type I glyceraldehyde-3-phosphate dehydrogenase [Flavobacteriales bacterium]